MLEDIDLIPLNELDEYENPLIKAHYIHPSGAEWHIIAGSPINNGTDILCFGIAKITVREMGEFTLNQILDVGAVRDTEWVDKELFTVFPEFQG